MKTLRENNGVFAMPCINNCKRPESPE